MILNIALSQVASKVEWGQGTGRKDIYRSSLFIMTFDTCIHTRKHGKDMTMDIITFVTSHNSPWLQHTRVVSRPAKHQRH